MSTEREPGIGWSVGLALGGLLLAALLSTPAATSVLALLLGFAFGELWRLHARTRRLARQLEALQQRTSDAVPVAVTTTDAPAQAAETQPTPMPTPVTLAPTIPHLAPPPVAAASKPSKPDFIERGIAMALDWLKRGNPLARAGIVILFFGGAFFAKYAADRGAFPVPVRMLLLAAGALVLLGLGVWLRKRQPVFAQTLQGGGVAGWYLTVFASFRLYALMPQAAALALMVLAAVTGAVLAVTQNALALAVISTGGGFLAPLLLSNGEGSLPALLTYYAVLNLGVFAVAWFRAWRVLNLLGFILTFGIAGLFRALGYQPEQRGVIDGFLLLFIALYIGVAVLNALRQKPDLKHYISGSLVFGTPLAGFALHASLIASIPNALTLSASGFGLVYLLLAWLLWCSRRENLVLLSMAFAVIGVGFISLAMPLAFDRHATAALWALEGAGLVWLGLRQQRVLPRIAGLGLQVLAAFDDSVLHLGTGTSGHAVLSSGPVGNLALAVAGLISGALLYRSRTLLKSYEQHFALLAALWSLAWWTSGGVMQIDRSLPTLLLGASLVFAAASSLALYALSRPLMWPLLRRAALWLLVVFATAGLISSLVQGSPVEHGGAWGWPALIVTGWLLLWRLDADAEFTDARGARWLHAALLWLAVLLLSWEASRRLMYATTGVWQYLPWGLLPAALLFTLAPTSLRPAWPLARHASLYRQIAGSVLAVVAALWLLTTNLAHSGVASGLVYLPLLNPLDVASAITLSALLLFGLRLSHENVLKPRDLAWALLPLTFLWLNSALLRGLHHAAGVPLTADGILRSTLAQASLSVFWGLLGFAGMTLGARRAQRLMWIVGASLMAVLVLKLFLIDTAGGSTLGRIVAFLIVGALLLVTGYLAPLPPKKQQAESQKSD